jgi:hypothetical protein
MNAIRRFNVLALCLGLSPVGLAGELDVSASTPDVEVSTRPEGRNFMRLPSLEYQFVLTANCPAALSARSVSLSIADTRVALEEHELDQTGRLELSVSVPAMQIAPVAVNNFCTRVDEEPEQIQQTSLRIPAVLSVQAALTCGGEEGSEVTYASRSLDVVLRCELREDAAIHSID